MAVVIYIIPNLVKMWLGRDSNPCAEEKEPFRKKRIAMQHCIPVRYRLGHGGQVLSVIVPVMSIRACYTHAYIHLMAHGRGYSLRYR